MNTDTYPRPSLWVVADRLDEIDAAAVAREQAQRYRRQDPPAMPGKPAGEPPLVRLGQGEYERRIWA